MGLRKTQFYDVCGTMNEVKRRICDRGQDYDKDFAAGIESLLEDAEFMINRMKTRVAEYEGFREKVHEILSGLEQVSAVDGRPAANAPASMRRRFGSESGYETGDIQSLCDAAEDIRTVAGTLENRLRNYMDFALKTREAFLAVKGNRPWLEPDQKGESLVQSIRQKWQAWLPPEPHCEKLLEFLGASRAYVLTELLPDGQPVVQFEDGGAMPMSLIRYDEKVRNFSPARFKQGSANH